MYVLVGLASIWQASACFTSVQESYNREAGCRLQGPQSERVVSEQAVIDVAANVCVIQRAHEQWQPATDCGFGSFDGKLMLY